MRYIIDDRGYVKYCSNNYITCENKTCTPYEGDIPDGYETIEEWVQNANIRAYKIVDGNLVFDEEEDARLQEEYAFNGRTIYEGKLIGGQSTTLSNVKRFLEVYFAINFNEGNVTGKYIIDTQIGRNNICHGSAVKLAFDVANGSEYYVSQCTFDKDTNVITHSVTGYFSISAGSFAARNENDSYYVYRIDTYN